MIIEGNKEIRNLEKEAQENIFNDLDEKVLDNIKWNAVLIRRYLSLVMSGVTLEDFDWECLNSTCKTQRLAFNYLDEKSKLHGQQPNLKNWFVDQEDWIEFNILALECAEEAVKAKDSEELTNVIEGYMVFQDNFLKKNGYE